MARSGFFVSNVKLDNSYSYVTNFDISSGHYYVCGILCDNRIIWDDTIKKLVKAENFTYGNQPFYPLPQPEKLPLLVYLDVWEREVNHLQDASLREVALGGPDTTTRSQVVWQVKLQPFKDGLIDINNCEKGVIENWHHLINTWQPAQRGELKVKAKVETPQTEPCTINPESSYQGPENQLYRVEIHKSGSAGNATFKWSRENGAVVYPIAPHSLPATGTTAEITLESWWSSEDDPRTLKVNDWVEIVNEDYILLQKAEPLWRVSEITPEEQKIKLTRQDASSIFDVSKDAKKHPMLRRWDGIDTVVKESTTDWFPLEYGIKIQFQSHNNSNHYYRTGDYWLIPARVATGDVEWPTDDQKNPVALPPHGIRHHYAPLAIIDENGITVLDCRRQFYSLARTYYHIGSGAGVGTDLIFPDACDGIFPETT